jgi:endonuclease YncB( thermonuclease family)
MTTATSVLTAGIVMAAAVLMARTSGAECPRAGMSNRPCANAPQPQRSIEGQAGVISGDTLVVSGERFRLQAIDALERNQSCIDADGTIWAGGREAKAWLEATIRNNAAGQVSCSQGRQDRHGNAMGACFTGRQSGQGIDLGGEMVRQGYAIAFLLNDYRQLEMEAQAAGRGMWKPGRRCDQPSEWRRTHHLQGQQGDR